jgi:hypothetical protein
MCTTVAEIRSMKKLRFYSYELEENIVKWMKIHLRDVVLH